MVHDASAFLSAMDRNPHLRSYVDDFVSKTGKEPQFHVTMSRDMETMVAPSIIYPIGDPLYIHLYQEPGELMRYLTIVPLLSKEDKLRYEEILNSLILAGLTSEEDPDNIETLKMMLNSLLDDIILIGDQKFSIRSIISGLSPIKKVYLDQLQNERIRYHIITNLTSMGILEPLMRDDWVEDISCNGLGDFFIIHKIFKTLQTNVGLTNDRELDELCYRLSEVTGKPIRDANPICDGALPDSSRINILFSRDISKKG